MAKTHGSTTGRVHKPSLDVTPKRGGQIGQKGQAGTEETSHNGANSGSKT